jgi:hypothetical protein
MRYQTVTLAARAAALAAAFSCLSAANGLAAPPAQTMAPPAQTMAPPRAMPLPPRPAADDPAKVAAARDFIIAFHPRTDPKVLAAMLDKAMPRILAEIKQQNPKADAKKVVQQQRTAYLANATQALDMQAHVISRHFSLQELKGLTAFYRGPLGKKLVDELANIQAEMMREQQLRQPPGGAPVMMQPPQGPAMRMAPQAPAMNGAPPKKP